jgi:hypothetical protein
MAGGGGQLTFIISSYVIGGVYILYFRAGPQPCGGIRESPRVAHGFGHGTRIPDVLATNR